MKILLTGASGFLGKNVLDLLIKEGHSVYCVGRKDIQMKNVLFLKGDIKDENFLKNAFSGMEAVFHIASKVGIYGTKEDFYNTNVLGTKNVISACLKNSIKYLVYTSTPSVVFNKEDIINANESIKYAKNYKSFYAETKSIAEKDVLDANCRSFCGNHKIVDFSNNESCLKTIALRPHLILGEDDPHMIPKIIQAAKHNKLSIIGDGKNIVDISYVKDVAKAHLLAMKAIQFNPLETSGKPYFISQGDPIILWEWINELLGQLNIKHVTRKIPFNIAYFFGTILEKISYFTKKEPIMSRFLALQLAKDHYFDISSAKKDLGYLPQTSSDDILKMIVYKYSSPHFKEII